MSGTTIGRLTLDLPAMPAERARSLALSVAAGLAQATGMSGGADIPSLRVLAEAGPPDTLAQRIVAETLRQIRRAP